VEPESKVCAHVKRVMLSRKWKSQFPVDSVGLVFDTSPPSCTFDTMLTMIQDSDRTNSATVATLKEYLASRYADIAVNRLPELLQAFIAAGKKRIATRVKQRATSIEHAVLSDDYYLTNLDVILIAQHYKIPLVMFSSTLIVENKKPVMMVYSQSHVAHYYIKTPGVVIDTPLKYKLIVTTSTARIPTSQLSSELQDTIRADSDHQVVSVDAILDSFKTKSAKKLVLVEDLPKSVKKKKGKTVILE